MYFMLHQSAMLIPFQNAKIMSKSIFTEGKTGQTSSFMRRTPSFSKVKHGRITKLPEPEIAARAAPPRFESVLPSGGLYSSLAHSLGPLGGAEALILRRFHSLLWKSMENGP